MDSTRDITLIKIKKETNKVNLNIFEMLLMSVDGVGQVPCPPRTLLPASPVPRFALWKASLQPLSSLSVSHVSSPLEQLESHHDLHYQRGG